METFHGWWIFSLFVLIVFAMLIGRAAPTESVLGVLVDSRGRYSLTHFQVVTWTIVILSSLVGALIASGWTVDQLKLSPELLGLMGISAGSGVLATGVKAAKDSAEKARVARFGVEGLELSDGNKRTIGRSLSQVWLLEEGDQADQVIDVTKFQNFVFTIIAVFFYVTLACKQGKIPELPEDVVWLIGISHAGYVGGKAPDKG